MSELAYATEIIAHDLVSPLAHAAQQLRRIQHSARPVAADIDQVAVRIETVLDRLRTSLRISDLELHHRNCGFSRIDLTDVMTSIFDLYQPLAEAEGEQLLLQADRGAFIDGDADLLAEALANLVSNAIKFAHSPSTVRICLNPTPYGPQVVVQDNGLGMPYIDRQVVLQRFYRSGRGRLVCGSSGLGLSVVAAIVRLHRFSLQLEDAGPGLRAVINCWPSAAATI